MDDHPLTKGYLLLLLFLMISLDVVFTIGLVHKFGPSAELNPLMRYVIEQYGYVGFVLTKAVPFGMLCILSPRISSGILATLTGIFGCLMIWWTWVW